MITCLGFSEASVWAGGGLTDGADASTTLFGVLEDATLENDLGFDAASGGPASFFSSSARRARMGLVVAGIHASVQPMNGFLEAAHCLLRVKQHVE